MALSAGHGNNLVDGSLGTAAFTTTTGPIRCRLMTVNGSGTANGTEVVTGGGYTSGTGAPSVTFAPAATVSTNSQAASSSAVTVTNYPRAETVVGVELWDSAGTPIRKHWGALTASKTMAAADTFSISSAALTVALSQA